MIAQSWDDALSYGSASGWQEPRRFFQTNDRWLRLWCAWIDLDPVLLYLRSPLSPASDADPGPVPRRIIEAGSGTGSTPSLNW